MINDEEQDFKILEVLIKTDIESISFNDLSYIIDPIVGGGEWEIIHDMVKRGLIRNGFLTMDSASNDGFGITKAGRNKYLSIKTKNRNQKIANKIIWVTLFFSAVSAIYGILTYYKDDPTKRQPQQTTTLLPQQKQANPTQTSTPDSKVVLQTHLSDSLTKIKFDTKYIDTDVLKHKPVDKNKKIKN